MSTRKQRTKANIDFFDDLAVKAHRGDRWRHGRGYEFCIKHKGWRLIPTSDQQMRKIGEEAYRDGGIPRMREVFFELNAVGVNVGTRWDKIGGWYS
jgi:hypothetical protein